MHLSATTLLSLLVPATAFGEWTGDKRETPCSGSSAFAFRPRRGKSANSTGRESVPTPLATSKGPVPAEVNLLVQGYRAGDNRPKMPCLRSIVMPNARGRGALHGASSARPGAWTTRAGPRKSPNCARQ
ncbi:hypothetical protein B0H14DRAFT_2571904 [Mycena olivaceomarginata]|nr:hypothetical protein B0H14DRAFT_2571904 [Mycena olivaceomarginata]